MPLSGFHPAVARWFEARFREPTEPQRRAWPVIQAGRNALIAAPTGSGKTFAAFLAAIDSLLRQGVGGPPRHQSHGGSLSAPQGLSQHGPEKPSRPLPRDRPPPQALCP